MFWNKKEVVKVETETELLDIHYVGKLGKRFIESVTYSKSESDSDKYLIVKAIEQASLKQRQTDSKLNLILDHLKLKYVPETETKQPAKLVEKVNKYGLEWGSLLSTLHGHVVEPKKKRGRPKKK